MSDDDAKSTLIGQIGCVTLAGSAGRPGQVMLNVRGGSEAFAARCDEPIPKHARVVVIEDRAGRSVTVAPC